MSTDETRAFIQHWIDEVWNNKRLELVDELVAEDYQRHDPGIPLEVRGPESLKQLIGMYFTAFPDLHLATEQVIAENNRAAVLLTASGTNSGEFMGAPATGKTASVKSMEMFRIENNKIVEQWVNLDALNMLRQLGMA
jgi:steroid delta-isomerase-like uncharacterized protein